MDIVGELQAISKNFAADLATAIADTTGSNLTVQVDLHEEIVEGFRAMVKSLERIAAFFPEVE